MNKLVLREPTLIGQLKSIDIDFFACYQELSNKATRDDRYLTFDEVYDDISSRVLDKMLLVEPEKRDVSTYRCERTDVWDALESCRLLYETVDGPPRPKGGGFSCLA